MPGERGKGLIALSDGRPQRLELFSAPLDEHGHDSLVMVEDLRRHLGLRAEQVRVVRVENDGGGDVFRIDDVNWVSPAPADADLIKWVTAAEPRIAPALPYDHELDPSLWQHDSTS